LKQDKISTLQKDVYEKDTSIKRLKNSLDMQRKLAAELKEKIERQKEENEQVVESLKSTIKREKRAKQHLTVSQNRSSSRSVNKDSMDREDEIEKVQSDNPAEVEHSD
jgi:hypothetical protein